MTKFNEGRIGFTVSQRFLRRKYNADISFYCACNDIGVIINPYHVIAATSNPAFDPNHLMQSEIYHFAQSDPLADFSSDKIQH